MGRMSPVTEDMHEAANRFLERFRSAWDEGDARAFAALFTESATYVVFVGEALIGRAEIERNHVDVFTRWQKGTKMSVRTVAVQPIGPEVCCVLTVGGIGEAPPIAYDKLQTFTLVRQSGEWFCAAFQNAAMSRRTAILYNAPTAGG